MKVLLVQVVVLVTIGIRVRTMNTILLILSLLNSTMLLLVLVLGNAEAHFAFVLQHCVYAIVNLLLVMSQYNSATERDVD